MIRNRRFKGGEIPTGSMADIAFLLLVFFLVTTTIDTDKGLGIVLPPAGDVEIEIQKKNILNCLINSQGKVLLDEEPTDDIDKPRRYYYDRMEWIKINKSERDDLYSVGLENLRVLCYQLGLFGKHILTDENGKETEQIITEKQ